MAAFANKFFSLAGQKERLSNVGKYAQLTASKLTLGIIKAPVQNTTYKPSGAIENVAQKVAEHPYLSAAAVTGTVMAAKRIPQATSAVKSAVAKVKNRSSSSVSPMKTNSNKPGIVKTVLTNAGGMLQKSAAPASPVPVSPNAGILPASGSSVRAPSTSRKRRAPAKRRKSTKKRSKRTRKTTTRRKSRKKRYGTAKQYARKGGKSVKYTKNGQPYIILSDGRARFVKGKRK